MIRFAPGFARARSRRLAAVVFIAATCLACGDGLAPGEVARVGSRGLEYDSFRAYVEESTGEPAESLESSVLRGLFEQFLEEELLLELARDKGLVGPEAGHGEAAAALFGPEQVAVDDAELRREFAARSSELAAPERVRLRHLLFEEAAPAELARARLVGGDPAIEVAEELGALGSEEIEAAREDLPHEYAETLLGLEVGGVAVVGDGFQHHVFVVMAHQPAGPLSFDEAAPLLRRRLVLERARALREALLREARDRYTVRIAAARLPFALSPEVESRPTSPPADP